MITITNTSRELTKLEKYLMSADNGVKSMKDVEDGQSIKVVAWLEFTDVKDNGEEANMLSILDDENNAYTTQSDTFKESFMNMVNCMDGEFFSIIKFSGKTNSGREYVNCKLDKASIA